MATLATGSLIAALSLFGGCGQRGPLTLDGRPAPGLVAPPLPPSSVFTPTGALSTDPASVAAPVPSPASAPQ